MGPGMPSHPFLFHTLTSFHVAGTLPLRERERQPRDRIAPQGTRHLTGPRPSGHPPLPSLPQPQPRTSEPRARGYGGWLTQCVDRGQRMGCPRGVVLPRQSVQTARSTGTRTGVSGLRFGVGGDEGC